MHLRHHDQLPSLGEPARQDPPQQVVRALPYQRKGAFDPGVDDFGLGSGAQDVQLYRVAGQKGEFGVSLLKGV